MRRIRPGVLLTLTVVLAACGEQQPRSAFAPSMKSVVVVPSPAPGCLGLGQLDSAIAALVPPGPTNVWLNTQLDSIVALIGPILGGPDSAAAQTLAVRAADSLAHAYLAGTLIGGTSDATRLGAAALINGFLCFPGLAPDFPADALGPDGAVALLSPSTPDTTITTDTRHAGVRVDSGSVTQTVLLTISRLPDAPGPLLTQLDQYPLFYEFTVTPDVPFEIPVLVGTCQSSGIPDSVANRLRIAHNVPPYTPGSIQILPYAPATFLDCSNVTLGLRSSNPLVKLALAGWHAVTALLEPRPLLAATGGVGGTAKTFSPFGAVDTLVYLTPRSDTAQTGIVGDTAASAPSVMIRTFQGHPVTGDSVAFAVTAGGGSLTGAATATDTAGVATVGSWTLGPTPGVNVVTATAAPPQLRAGVAGSPQRFTDTAVAPLRVLVDCPPFRGAGDDLDRGFYLPRYPGSSLAQVTLYLSANGHDQGGRQGTPYSVALVARSGGFDGPVIGTGIATVTLRGDAAENRPAQFTFPGNPGVTPNSLVTFQFRVLSNPNGARLRFDVGKCRIGDRDCRTACPVVETDDARGRLSEFRRLTCAITIVGAGDR